jgi:predicted amidohydrolase
MLVAVAGRSTSGRSVMRTVRFAMAVGALVASVGAPSLPAQQKARAASAPPVLAFRHVTVIDVTDGRRIPEQTVVVVGRRIQAVGPTGRVRVPKGAQVVDARGKYLIPGLWDMHVHPRRLSQLFYPLFIAYGVTGVRDAGNEVPLDTLARWKRAIAAGTRVGPRMIVAGPALDERVPCTRTPGIHICVSSSADDARGVVDSLQAAGADFIKTYGLTKPIYLAIAAEARRRGIPFGGHIHAPDLSAQEASDSGASIIDHPNTSGGLDRICLTRGRSEAQCRALAERFRQNGTWWTATMLRFAVEGVAVPPPLLAIYSGFQRRVGTFWSGTTSPLDAGSAGETADVAHDPDARPGATNDSTGYLVLAQRVGLPILAATDVGAPVVTRMLPGLALHTELALEVAAGLTPLTALQAATLNPAKYLHATDSLGTVAPGKLADLVLLDADPLADIANTTAIRAVVADGRYFDRAALDRLTAEARREIAGTASPAQQEASPLRAPALTPGALVGTWKGIAGWDRKTAIDASGRIAPHLVVFRPDSTFTETWASYDGPRGCIAGRWTRLAGDTIAWAGGGSYRARLGAEAQELIFYAVPPRAAETAPGSETSTAAVSPLAFPVEAYQRVDSTDTADLQLAASCRAR